MRKFQDEDNRLCEGKNRLCEEKQRLCEEEQRKNKERKFQDGDDKKFQMDQNQQRSEGWRRPWSNGMMKNKWGQERNIDGKTENRWRQGSGKHEDWRQRDGGALGFFLCPVCLATHLVPRYFGKIENPIVAPIMNHNAQWPRSAFSLLPRVQNLPLRPLSLASLQAPQVHLER